MHPTTLSRKNTCNKQICGPVAQRGLCFLVSGPSRFYVVTWLAPSHVRWLCALSCLPPPTCLPLTTPAESMIRDLASDFRLWDK